MIDNDDDRVKSCGVLADRASEQQTKSELADFVRLARTVGIATAQVEQSLSTYLILDGGSR